jgi:hypothetical protein
MFYGLLKIIKNEFYLKKLAHFTFNFLKFSLWKGYTSYPPDGKIVETGLVHISFQNYTLTFFVWPIFLKLSYLWKSTCASFI